MKSLQYLNTVLTVIAVLLSLHLWTLWSAQSPGEGVSLLPEAHAAGIPNAGQQRKEIVDELRQVSHKIDDLVSLFRSGDAQVRMWRGEGGDGR